MEAAAGKHHSALLTQLLDRHSHANRNIDDLTSFPEGNGRGSGPLHRLQHLRDALSCLGDGASGKIESMLAISRLAASAGTPIFEDQKPEDFGVDPGFLAALLRTHAAGGDTDALISTYLKTGEGTAVNPGRYAPPERQTRLFEGQAKVDLPGLQAGFLMRTTGQDAPERLLPKDVTGLLKFQTGISGVIGSLEKDITDAVAAVRADQEAKMAHAHGLFDQVAAMIPALVESFRATLGTRTETVRITDSRLDRTETGPQGGDDSSPMTSRTRQFNEVRDVAISAPGGHGVLTLPSFTIDTGTSEAMQFSGAGFGMNDDEEAVVEIHRGAQAVEVIARGHTAFAAAQATEVRSEGVKIEFRGGSIKIGG